MTQQSRQSRRSRPTRAPRCLRAPWAVVIVMAALALGPGVGHAEPAVRLTLPQLMERAQQGPRARMARADTRTARARIDEVKGARYPKLSVMPYVGPTNEVTCANPDCTRTSAQDVYPGVDGVVAGARISLTQPLFAFGNLGAISEAARAAVRASERLEDAMAADLAAEAARAYYGLKLARELVWMLEDGMSEIDKALARTQEKLAEGAGEVTVQDRLRIETLRAEVLARLAEARQAVAVALAGVRALAGDTSVDVDEEALEPVDWQLGPLETYLEQAQARRPELQAARAGAEAMRARAQFEAAQYWPILLLSGELHVARASSVDDPPSAFAYDLYNTTSASVGLVLRWQLDIVTQRARVAQARAAADKAGALADLARDGAGFEVKQAHAEAQGARERVQAAQDGEKSARGWMAAVLQADVVGTAEAKDLADAFIAYFTLRARRLTSVYEWNLATVRLRRAIGEFVARPSVPRS